MLRKTILALVILVVTAVPLPALARDEHRDFDGQHESHGGHERFERHERFEHFHRPFFGVYPYGYYPYPYYVYAPPRCYWQPGYWVNQPYVDAWGRYSYVQQWVQPQYVCY
jgi:hypothetical protein